MGIPTEIFSLFEVKLPPRPPAYLLTRVRRREYANWNQADEDEAVTKAVNDESSMIAAWREPFGEGPESPRVVKIGEMQAAAGALAENPPIAGEIEIWVAESSFGPPWVIMDVAPTEEAFWDQVSANEDLTALRPRRPARLILARCLPQPNIGPP